MAKAISDAKAFRALLSGGYIRERCNGYRDERAYAVFERDATAETGYRNIGHITMRQFDGFEAENLVKFVEPVGGRRDMDSKGCVYHFYALVQPESGVGA